MAGKPAFINQFYRRPTSKKPVNMGKAAHMAAAHIAAGGKVNVGGGKQSRAKGVQNQITERAANYRKGSGAHIGREKSKKAREKAAAGGKPRA